MFYMKKKCVSEIQYNCPITSLQGNDEKRCYGRSDDIAEVIIAELQYTKKIGILPGMKEKGRYRRTVVIAENLTGEF